MTDSNVQLPSLEHVRETAKLVALFHDLCPRSRADLLMEAERLKLEDAKANEATEKMLS